MNAEESEIYQFLKGYGDNFVSAAEITKYLGHRRRYGSDRNWARPILRRMELDGHLQANAYGEYRLAKKQTDTSFKYAVSCAVPSVDLGETTIVSINSVKKRP